MDIIPFDDRDGVIWYNGKFIPWRDAKVHVLNHGLHYASSVFEGIRIYNSNIFKLTEHSTRLKKSAELLGFEIPYSIDELNEATESVIKAQGVVNGYIRPFSWRGSEKMAISASGNKIHTAIACWAWPPYYSEEARQVGLKLTIAKYRRPSPATAPTASKAAGLYMICTISKHEAEAAGYGDALMLDYRGFVAEATGANFFMIVGDELHTPIPDCFLNGITRLTIIDLARKRGIKVVERHISLEELATAHDAFLTGTAAEITRIAIVESESDTYKFSPHQMTAILSSDYKKLTGQI